MPSVWSKLSMDFTTIDTSCINYVHPWTNSCFHAMSGLYLYAIYSSFRLYSTVYLLTLFMKGRLPTKDELKHTTLGILQSTAFLSGMGFGYSLFLCSLRRLLGAFNIWTVSGMPAFLASVFSIFIERPSRRTLLALYVTNVATETIWNMALSRNYVRHVKYGDVMIFTVSMALLLAYFKGGSHKNDDTNGNDSMFRVLRFIVGPYEELDSTCGTFYRQRVAQQVDDSGPNNDGHEPFRPTAATHSSKGPLMGRLLSTYRKLIYKLKCRDCHATCLHPFSCVHYSLQGAVKMFSIGLSIQVGLKLLLNLRRILQRPTSAVQEVFFKRDTLNVAVFLGAYSGLFRGTMCLLRRTTGRDSAYHAFVAGLVAGSAFSRNADSTIALYVMWKAAQITYKIGIQKGYAPAVPGFTEFLYSFSTAVLFHAAIVEPMNLRPSYWRFLHTISGGRMACMNREPFDAWQLSSSKSLENVLKLTHTKRELRALLL